MPPNILVVRFSSFGDLLLTTPLLRAIRTRHPDARITFVIREDMADALRNNPRIDELVTFRKGSSLGALASRLRGVEWTHRLDLHGSLRSHLVRRLVGGRWTGYPKHRLRRAMLIATHRKRGGALGPVAERYFAAARDLDVRPDGGPPEFFPSAAAEERVARFLAQHGLGLERPVIALAPGAAHFTKRWPERHWIEFVREAGRERDVVVLGGRAEEVVAGAIVAASPGRAASAAGLFNHDANGAILQRSEMLVAGDTGVLHLATAVGTPVVGLYGPTVQEFGFFPYRARYVAVQHDLDCRPCSTQGTARCPLGHFNCLAMMQATEVTSAMVTLRGAAQERE